MGGGGDDGSEEESFEYTDDDEEDNQDDFEITIENAYYNAKGLKETDVGEAEEAFLGVITTEQEEMAKQAGDEGGGDAKKKYGPWSFKALKQLMKLHLQTNDTTKAMERYTELLVCVANGVVSPNAIEKGVNGMLERVSALLVQQGGGGAGGADDDAGDDDKKALARNVYLGTMPPSPSSIRRPDPLPTSAFGSRPSSSSANSCTR